MKRRRRNMRKSINYSAFERMIKWCGYASQLQERSHYTSDRLTIPTELATEPRDAIPPWRLSIKFQLLFSFFDNHPRISPVTAHYYLKNEGKTRKKLSSKQCS
jgi:hypothetical protein